MTQTLDTCFSSRLRSWLLAVPITTRSQETGFARSTLHDWLNGTHAPRGAVKRLVLAQIAAWERAELEAVPAPAQRVVVKPEPVKLWAR